MTHSCLLTLSTVYDDVQQFKFRFQTYLVKSWLRSLFRKLKTHFSLMFTAQKRTIVQKLCTFYGYSRKASCLLNLIVLWSPPWPLWNMCVTNDHGYVPLVVNTSWSFPYAWLITGFVTRVTRRVSLVEQVLLILTEYLTLHPGF